MRPEEWDYRVNVVNQLVQQGIIANDANKYTSPIIVGSGPISSWDQVFQIYNKQQNSLQNSQNREANRISPYQQQQPEIEDKAPMTPEQLNAITSTAQGLASETVGLSGDIFQTLRTPAEAPEAALYSQLQQNLEQRRAEQRAEADRAGVVAARDEMVQAGRDVGLAQQAALASTQSALGGAAGRGAAAAQGAQQAYLSGIQTLPSAIQAARQRKDIFEQKEVERRQAAAETQSDVNLAAQKRFQMQQKYQNMLEQNRISRGIQRQAGSAQRREDLNNAFGFANRTNAAQQNADNSSDSINNIGKPNDQVISPPGGSAMEHARFIDKYKGEGGWEKRAREAKEPEDKIAAVKAWLKTLPSANDWPKYLGNNESATAPTAPTAPATMGNSKSIASAMNKSGEYQRQRATLIQGLDSRIVANLDIFIKFLDSNIGKPGYATTYAGEENKEKIIAQILSNPNWKKPDDLLSDIRIKDVLSDEDYKCLKKVNLQRRFY